MQEAVPLGEVSSVSSLIVGRIHRTPIVVLRTIHLMRPCCSSAATRAAERITSRSVDWRFCDSNCQLWPCDGGIVSQSQLLASPLSDYVLQS